MAHGHSRSLTMSSFDRPHMTLYKSSIIKIKASISARAEDVG